MSETVTTPMRRLPRREMRIDLPEPYQDFSILGWMNFPRGVGADLSSGDEERVRSALMAVILDHDLVDEEGQPYPLASDPAFWEAIPTDVGGMLFRAFVGQVGQLPKATRTR
jgi:hypothetical protein